MVDIADRTLAEALGDNDESLYRYLRSIAARALVGKFSSWREDLIQDFLVDQLGREDDPYVLTADMSNGNINENPMFRGFLGKRFRWYISDWVKKQARRIAKPKYRSRPVEKVLFPHSIADEEGGKSRNDRLEYASMQRYRRDHLKAQLPIEKMVREKEPKERRELFDHVCQAITQLDFKYQRTLEAYYLEGLSASEIAEEMEVAHTTVTSRLYLGRKYLKQFLPDEANTILESLDGRIVS